MPDADDVAGADEQMRFAERDAPVDQLCRAGNDEQRVAILLELRPLVRMLGILDGKVMQVELLLHAVQQLAVRLEQADPHDMPFLARPFACLLDRDVGDAPAIGIDAGGNDAGVGTIELLKLVASIAVPPECAGLVWWI